jgi:hypothetical protein
MDDKALGKGWLKINGNKNGDRRNKNEGKTIFFSSLIALKNVNRPRLYASHVPDKRLPIQAKINIFCESELIACIVKMKIGD